jgi:anti-anti-sigma regulatory factor
MATNVVWLKVDAEHVAEVLQEARKKLDSAQEEVVLDFSSVHRIDAAAVRAIQTFADTADGAAGKVVFRGINVSIYKVLKLMKLARRFSFRA